MEEFLARESLSDENDLLSGTSKKEREFFEGAAYQAAIYLNGQRIFTVSLERELTKL